LNGINEVSLFTALRELAPETVVVAVIVVPPPDHPGRQ
jgi:hypothetical protein